MLIPFLVIIACGVFFGVITHLNSLVPEPQGTKTVESDCTACNISSCNLHPSHKEA